MSNFKDQNKLNFVRHFVIPEALKVIESKIRIKSQGLIPPFDPLANHCDDSDGKKPSLEISTGYHTEHTAADYLLYVGVVEEKAIDFSAYASFCITGRRLGRDRCGTQLTPDSQSGRPLVGYVVLNEDKLAYDDGKYHTHVSTFVHEVLHALYFHPKAFRLFPPNKSGQPFLYEESDGRGYLQGDNIVRQARDHYGCDAIDRGTLPVNIPQARAALTA